MRCKKHLPDVTSTIGVCASCLCERLQPLLAAQAQAQSQSQAQAQAQAERVANRRKPKLETEENTLPQLNFPRSVSPNVAGRKSDYDRHREKLFYGTPQLNGGGGGGGQSEKRRHGGRFWIFSNLFRGRSNKAESCEEPSASPPLPSWLSTFLPSRRHSHGGSDKRRCRNLNDEEDAVKERSDSGNSSETSPEKQNSTANRRSRMGPTGKGLKGMAFCLSPLVRASPNRHWPNKGLGHEFGGGGPHHISSAASFCPNRSRKLADFGRGAHNR